MKCSSRKCKNNSTHIVEKHSDLSHKKLNYCDACCKPYREYPEDFKVTKS